MDDSNNALTAFNPSYWARSMQEIFFKECVALGLANTELRDELVNGTVIYKPYRSYLVSYTYNKGVDIPTLNDLVATEDSLTVNTTKIVPFYVDDLDRIQNKWDVATQFAQDSQKVLNNVLDQAVLSNYSNARSFISAQDLGGSDTGSIPVGQANIANLFAVAARKLEAADVPTNNLCAVIGPRLMEQLKLYVAGRETGFGDVVGDNGKVGQRFGFELYQSNNIPFKAVLTHDGTVNTAGGTVTVDGVIFTWAATGTNCDVAGEVDLGANADAGLANLALAINGTVAGTTATYCDISVSDRRKLRKHGITATVDTVNDTITIDGFGDVAITENSNHLTYTSNTQYPLFMMKGAIDLITKKAPSVEFRVAERRLGRFVYPWMLYGTGTFDSMKDAMTYAKVDTSDWV